MNLAVRKVRSFAGKRKDQIASKKMLIAGVAFDLSRIFDFVPQKSLTKWLAGLLIHENTK